MTYKLKTRELNCLCNYAKWTRHLYCPIYSLRYNVFECILTG